MPRARDGSSPELGTINGVGGKPQFAGSFIAARHEALAPQLLVPAPRGGRCPSRPAAATSVIVWNRSSCDVA